MTLLTKRALIGISTPNPSPNHRLAGALLAGESLDTADACTLRAGRVYKASGAAADADARIFGWTAAPASAGEAVTLYDHVTIEYGTGLSMGTLVYLSGTTPGGLETAPSTGGTTPCGVALDSTRVHVVSTWAAGNAGGGAATVEAPLVLTGTSTVQAPLSVVQEDSGTNTAPNVMALTHSLSSGTAEAGMGAGLAFRLQRDDDVVHLAAALVAVWTDPGGLGELRVPVYDDTTPYTLRWMPSGLFVPNASAEPALPINGGVFWIDAGALKYKGSSGTVTTLGPA